MIDTTESVYIVTAGVVERAYDLILDGWIKGAMNNGSNTPTQFCIMGALELASQELIGSGLIDKSRHRESIREIIDLAAVIICHMAEINSTQSVNIPSFNDNTSTEKDHVLSVMRRSADYFWDMSIQDNRIDVVDLSKFNNIISNNKMSKQFLTNEIYTS